MHLQILKCPFLSFISGTHLGLIFKKGFSSSFLSSSSFTVCVDSPICMYPRSGSPPSLPAHQPLQDHGYERARANVRDITHHFIKIKKNFKQKSMFYLPYLYLMGGVFSFSTWWSRGVKILQASLNSSLWWNKSNSEMVVSELF